jgi:hypothetical protein
MGSGAKEVPVRISGGGRDADCVQAHLAYIDREVRSDHGPSAARARGVVVVNDWGLALDVQAARIRSESGSSPCWRVTRINPKVKFGHSDNVGEFAQP